MRLPDFHHFCQVLPCVRNLQVHSLLKKVGLFLDWFELYLLVGLLLCELMVVLVLSSQRDTAVACSSSGKRRRVGCDTAWSDRFKGNIWFT